MELKQIKGIGPAKQAKLEEAGIKNVKDLAKCDVAAVAKAADISEEHLKEYKQKAIGMVLLEDVKDMGPATVQTLAEAGIRSARDLYEASSERIAAEAKVAQQQVQEWQAEAKVLMERVRSESKTPEGRQKLIAEGKDAAQKAARIVQAESKAALERAQKEGESALEMFQKLRANAPQYVQDAKERADRALGEAESLLKDLQQNTPERVKEYQARVESAAKEAERRVLEFRDKTEQAVRAEAEKFKAANEGLLGRIKQRFQRSPPAQ